MYAAALSSAVNFLGVALFFFLLYTIIQYVLKIPENLMTNIMDCIYKGAKANKLKEYVELFNDTIAAIENRSGWSA